MEELSYSQMKALRDKVREANQKRWLEQCKMRLISIIEKRIQTAFIGPLDIFEKTFGFLWEGNEYGKRTTEQEQLYQLWKQARTEILNVGNNQIRSATTEIDNHAVNWNRYHVDLKVCQEK